MDRAELRQEVVMRMGRGGTAQPMSSPPLLHLETSFGTHSVRAAVAGMLPGEAPW